MQNIKGKKNVLSELSRKIDEASFNLEEKRDPAVLLLRKTRNPPIMKVMLPLKSCLKAHESCMKHNESNVGSSPVSSPTSVVDQRRKSKRRVAFCRIQIHQFDRILGDNPSCSEGAPVTFGQEPHTRTAFELEYYEAYNPSDKRRRKEALKLSAPERSAM